MSSPVALKAIPSLCSHLDDGMIYPQNLFHIGDANLNRSHLNFLDGDVKEMALASRWEV